MIELKFKGELKELVKRKNIAEDLSDEDLGRIGLLCKEEFESDKASRSEWEEWYGDAMKLALQVMEEKSYPWPNCSNVKLPIITIAAINFHARAYPTLVNGKDVVTYRPIGEDKDGVLGARAARVSNHQNYQLLEATDWEEQTDRALINVPIMGCTFKKSYFDHDQRQVVSRVVLAMDLVVPYYTQSLETTPRISETFSLNPNAFKTRVRRGLWLDWEYQANYNGQSTDAMVEARNEAQQLTPTSFPNDAPDEFVEQHRGLDLDGDGYAEPYIVTFVRSTGQICRIVARFNIKDVEYSKKNKDQVAYIKPTQAYTKYSFIPSPDGGFYDLGFGMLLGPLNYAADSLINQLIDAGTMHNLGGGFLGRGVKIRKGESTFEPNEWKSVDSTGPSLKDNIVPLPTRTPSQVLLDLLTFLVQYSERVSSANEVQMGELPGQNAKSGAMEIANQNGLKIFAAIYKRLWRCFKEEFVKIYQLTATYQAAEGYGGRDQQTGKWFQLQADDYSLPASGIWPAANPDVASPEQELKQAKLVMDTVMAVPGQDMYEATMRFYKALRVPQPDKIFPDPKGENAIQSPPDSKVIIAQAKMMDSQTKMQEVQYQKAVAIAEALRKVDETQAKILELQASAQKLQAEAKGVGFGHAIALIDAEIAVRKHSADTLLGVIKLMREQTNAGQAAESAGSGASANSGGPSLSGMALSTGNPTLPQVPNGQTSVGAGSVVGA